jgi:hypothetical protein
MHDGSKQQQHLMVLLMIVASAATHQLMKEVGGDHTIHARKGRFRWMHIER